MKSIKIRLFQESQSQGRHLNLIPNECEAGRVPSRRRRSVGLSCRAAIQMYREEKHLK